MNRSERRRQAKLARRGGGDETMTAPLYAAIVGHLEQGRPHEAAPLCNKLLKLRPDDPEALNLAGIAAFRSGKAERAVQLLRKAVGRRPDHLDALNNLGNVLRARGALADAEAAYRKALEIAPDHVNSLFNLGLALEALDRPDEALEAYDRAVALQSDFAAAHLSRANALKALGRYEAAEAGYRRTLELAPDHPDVHNNLGVVLRERGRLDEAEACYRRALERAPGHADARYNLGIVLQDQERLAEAEACYRQVVAFTPDYIPAHVNLGYALQRQGQLDDAIAAYRRAIALAPDYAGARVNLADALLQERDPAAALAACDEFLAAQPGDTAVLAFKALVLDELGEDAATRALLDTERFLRPHRFTAAPGFPDLDAFNAALADHLRGHPTLIEAPASHAPKDGRHSGELLVEPKGPVAALEAMIREAVEAYVAALPAGSGHPFVAARPRRTDLSIWGVVLTGAGHQIPHIHPAAWLSGVYYARVPATVEAPGEGNAGWIEFGLPPEHFHCRARPRIASYRPEEGLMLLFPSYLYHHTVPFSGTAERVSLAFDLRPAP